MVYWFFGLFPLLYLSLYSLTFQVLLVPVVVVALLVLSPLTSAFLVGTLYLFYGLRLPVEDDAVAHLLAFQRSVDGRLGADGEIHLVAHHELARAYAEQEVLPVGDHTGAMLHHVKRRQLEQVLQVAHTRLGVAVLPGIHVAAAHHLGAVRVVAVHVGTVVVALLLRRVHLLLGNRSDMLLLFDAGAYHLLAFFFACHRI